SQQVQSRGMVGHSDCSIRPATPSWSWSGNHGGQQSVSQGRCCVGSEFARWQMPEFRRRYFDSHKSYSDFFKETHAAGALDAKTKELMHLALVLALHCEP